MMFRIHRFPNSLEGVLGDSALDYFRCAHCRRMLPIENKVTKTDFFPATQDVWRKLAKHLRSYSGFRPF